MGLHIPKKTCLQSQDPKYFLTVWKGDVDSSGTKKDFATRIFRQGVKVAWTHRQGRGTRAEVAHWAKWLPVVIQVPCVREGDAASLSFWCIRGAMKGGEGRRVWVLQRDGQCSVSSRGLSKSPFRGGNRCRIEIERAGMSSPRPWLQVSKIDGVLAVRAALLRLFLWDVHSSCAGPAYVSWYADGAAAESFDQPQGTRNRLDRGGDKTHRDASFRANYFTVGHKWCTSGKDRWISCSIRL